MSVDLPKCAGKGGGLPRPGRKGTVRFKRLLVIKSEPLSPGYVRYMTGWVFSDLDERRRKRAEAAAGRFMQSYGQGERPYVCMIDKSHYQQQHEKE